MSKEVSLCSLDGVGEALLENELIVIADGDRDHEGMVWRQVLWSVELNELSQEEILRILVITDNVLNHNYGVVGISLLVSWEELG